MSTTTKKIIFVDENGTKKEYDIGAYAKNVLLENGGSVEKEFEGILTRITGLTNFDVEAAAAIAVLASQQDNKVNKKGSEIPDYNSIPDEYGLWCGFLETLNKLSNQSGEFVINTSWPDGKTGAQIAVGTHGNIMGYRTKYLDNVWRPWKQLAALSALGATSWDSGNFPVEYGTWTPTLRGGTTAGAFTYSRQFGYYCRRGREVRIWLRVTVNTVTTAPSGRLEIGGLPFVLSVGDDVAYANAFNITESSTISGIYPDIGFIFTSNRILMRKDKLTYFDTAGIATGYAISGSGVYLTN